MWYHLYLLYIYTDAFFYRKWGNILDGIKKITLI